MLLEFKRRMEFETCRGTHTQFMESLSAASAREYINAFDRWLVRKNDEATGEDYYWRATLMGHFFPDPRKQMADLERAVALDPGNGDIWVSLGHMAVEKKRWRQALDYYEGGIKAVPGNFFPWYGRSLVYRELGHFEESLRDITHAIRLHPYLAYGCETRGRIYEKMGLLEKAVADLDAAVRLDASTKYAQHYRAELRKKLERKNSLDC